ncbi:MAG: pseudouridine synthase [Verrucomicrobiales bacterium]
MLVRLQKYLADAGIASRRASEQLILDGQVTVNGKVVRELGAKVDPAKDSVSFEGKVIKPKKKLYLAINKPPGYICSRNDPGNRRTLNELLPNEWANLFSVGRLDYQSEGLIFYTNDGDFSLKLTHPRYGIEKKYMVVVKGEVTQEITRSLIKGIFNEGEVLKAQKVRILQVGGGVSILEIILKQGKNREIRRMFESLGMDVERLQRVQIGKIKLGQLPKGKWRTLTEAEIKSLISPTNSAAT